MKKAQGISINTIIIAAIALVVLVVLIAVFTGRMSIFGWELSNIQKGNYCSATMTQGISCPDGFTQIPLVRKCTDNTESEYIDKCAKDGLICCVEG
ncbi:MAG: hypothetical protein KAK00_09110 [Nanoarchaeota archaeon]|nr:hypothetical protein [Nanoarchaeota archaeon]